MPIRFNSLATWLYWGMGGGAMGVLAGSLKAGASWETGATAGWRAEARVLRLPFLLLPRCDLLDIYPPMFQIHLALG